MAINDCRWARPRLPLLAGGDLAGEERRNLERHLIGCPSCRSRTESARGALAALRIVAESRPETGPAARPLWPALARQIRETRHAAPRGWFGGIAVADLKPWPLLGLGLAVAAALLLIVRRPAAVPVVPTSLEVSARGVGLVPRDAGASWSVPARRSAVPTGVSGRLTQGEGPSFGLPPALRYEYDLDRGVPIGSGHSDPQRSY